MDVLRSHGIPTLLNNADQIVAEILEKSHSFVDYLRKIPSTGHSFMTNWVTNEDIWALDNSDYYKMVQQYLLCCTVVYDPAESILWIVILRIKLEISAAKFTITLHPHSIPLSIS